MSSNKLPTADYKEFDDATERKIFRDKKSPLVVKYDGLAAGKGVDRQYFRRSKRICLKLLKSGNKIIIEDFIRGMNFLLYTYVIPTLLRIILAFMD